MDEEIQVEPTYIAQTQIGILPTKGRILIDIFDTGEKVIKLGGKDFIILGDTKLESHHTTMENSHPGIRPRWAKILATSIEAEKDGLKVGDVVLCEQLRWSRKLKYNDVVFSMIPVEDVIVVDETVRETDFTRVDLINKY